MGTSFANRRSAAALLITAGLIVSACGGDDGKGGGTTPGTDGGGGAGGKDGGIDAGMSGVDSSVPSITDDASVAVDAGADELAAAYASAGVVVTARRADLVFTGACNKALECNMLYQLSMDTTVAACIADERAGYQEGVDAGFGNDCLDAVLDVNGCLARATNCDTLEQDCATELDAQMTLCAPYSDAGLFDNTGDSGV